MVELGCLNQPLVSPSPQGHPQSLLKRKRNRRHTVRGGTNVEETNRRDMMAGVFYCYHLKCAGVYVVVWLIYSIFDVLLRDQSLLQRIPTYSTFVP